MPTTVSSDFSNRDDLIIWKTVLEFPILNK